jgi:uncharacterized protein YabN with tetrapyrrole methylase and pyrophosphatase domain
MSSAWNRLYRWLARRQRGSSGLEDLPVGSSPLRQAKLYGDNCGELNFDWDGPQEVLAKVREELAELMEAIESDQYENIEEELGDLLFSISQLARKLGVDPERALQLTNEKFARRFRQIEAKYGYERDALSARTTVQLISDWEDVKREERSPPS